MIDSLPLASGVSCCRCRIEVRSSLPAPAMTWILAFACKLYLSASTSLYSLKSLKQQEPVKVSSSSSFSSSFLVSSLPTLELDNPHASSPLQLQTSLLMSWTIYGLLCLWEFLIEESSPFRLPSLYFYLKSALLLLVSFPALRINALIFDYLVLAIDSAALRWGHSSGAQWRLPLTAFELLLTLPIQLLEIIFPSVDDAENLGSSHDQNSMPDSNSSGFLLGETSLKSIVVMTDLDDTQPSSPPSSSSLPSYNKDMSADSRLTPRSAAASAFSASSSPLELLREESSSVRLKSLSSIASRLRPSSRPASIPSSSSSVKDKTATTPVNRRSNPGSTSSSSFVQSLRQVNRNPYN